MGVTYFSEADFIKKRHFQVMVPAYFDPSLPDDFADPKTTSRVAINPFTKTAVTQFRLSPIRPMADPSQMQQSSLPIETMLIMHRKRIRFSLINESDIVEILEGIDQYLLSLQTDVAIGDDYAIRYARVVVDWRKEVFKIYCRFINLRPDAFAELFPNRDPKKNILSLIRLLGMQKDYEKDIELNPLLAKQHPPYDIDKTIPRAPDTTAVVDPYSNNGSLGIANNQLDFDVNEFLSNRLVP